MVLHAILKLLFFYDYSSIAVVPNLGPPDVLGLQLAEAFITTSAGQDFWELKSKNIWRAKVGDPWATSDVAMSQMNPESRSFINMKY